MGNSSYSGGRSKNDTSFNSAVSQISYNKLQGLSSQPKGVTDPDKFYKLHNFLKDEYGFWESRVGLVHKEYLPNTAVEPDHYVEFIPSGSTESKLVIVTLDRVFSYKPETGLDVLTYGGNETFLSNTLEVRKACTYNNKAYIVDGSQYIYKYDGTTVTRMTFPYVSDYGNPVTIDEFIGRLWVGTDKNYVCYTAFNSDTVWEERILMVGTGAVSGTTLTGTNTIFMSAQIAVGDRLLLVQGSTEEYVYVSAISSNTSITLRTTPSNSFTTANIFYIGNRFADSVGSNDGLIIKDIQPFGNNLAISKAQDFTPSKLGKLYVLQPSLATDPYTNLPIGSTLLNKINTQENYTNIHPYSMEEYKGFLVYVADKKIKALTQTTNTGDLILEPEDLSDGKLETIFEDLNPTYKHKTRLNAINNQEFNILVLSAQKGLKVDTIVCGVFEKETGMQYSTLSLPATIGYGEVYDPSVQLGGYFINYRDYAVILTTNSIAHLWETNETYDTIITQHIPTFDSTAVTWDSSIVKFEPFRLVATPIYKTFETGVTQNDDWNKFNVYKYCLTSSESKPNPTLFNGANTYNVSLILDNKTNTPHIDMEYAKGSFYGYLTFDSEYSFTFDSLTNIFDKTNFVYSNKIRNDWFAFVKACRSMAVHYSDSTTAGRLKLLSYGYTLRSIRHD